MILVEYKLFWSGSNIFGQVQFIENSAEKSNLNLNKNFWIRSKRSWPDQNNLDRHEFRNWMLWFGEKKIIERFYNIFSGRLWSWGYSQKTFPVSEVASGSATIAVQNGNGINNKWSAYTKDLFRNGRTTQYCPYWLNTPHITGFMLGFWNWGCW